MSTRKRIRKLLKELEQDLSSFREELSTERESSFQRRTEQRDTSGVRPDPFPWTILGGISLGLFQAAPLILGAAAIPSFLGGISGAGVDACGEETIMERSSRQKIADVREVIDEDKLACKGLYSSLRLLEECVAEFAVFCRDHIDLVLSSKLVEGEFRFLLCILRGTHSPRAAANAPVPLPVLLDEEVNIHAKRVDTLMEQLKHSKTNREALATTRKVVDKFPEGPNDEEIRTMIMNFIEAKFAEACKS